MDQLVHNGDPDDELHSGEPDDLDENVIEAELVDEDGVDIPIIGLGGIATLDDALEFFMAGASAVQLGTTTFTNPGAMAAIIDGLPAWLAREGFASVREIVGLAQQRRGA